MTDLQFPPGFQWGSATASYQVEGAVDEDGRGPSIWDAFCATPGAVHDGDTGREACDHYHRYPADIALMADLGLTTYRFSIAWPRIQPTGQGPAHPAGIDHYRRVAEELLQAGIQPVATLYHWDLPQALQDLGGWPNRDTAQRFAEYAALVYDGLGDLVPSWITLNEPWVASHLGYGNGGHAPGISDGAQCLAATHHLLLGHGLAAAALRSRRHPDTQIGITVNLTVAVAASDDPADQAAARRVDGDSNRLFLDPLLRGSYPDDMIEWFDGKAGGNSFAFVRDGDLEQIAAPLDFLGVNYYTRHHVKGRAQLDGPADVPAGSGPRVTLPALDIESVLPDGVPRTAMGWPVEPDGLRQLLVRLHDDYPSLPPIFITENGAAYDDAPAPDGTVDDPERITYLDGHLRAVHQAIEVGVEVRGYFVWSLMDNFEWSEGYAKRFGIIYVDYPTQTRTPKSSAQWYAGVARANGLTGTDAPG